MTARAIVALVVFVAAAVASAAEPPAPSAPPRAGEVVLAADFEDADPLAGWKVYPAGTVAAEAGFQSPHAVRVEVAADAAKRTAFAEMSLPVERMRGCTILLSARIKAENVSAKPQSWNGIKFMAPYTAGGSRSHPQAEIGTGTFDWRRVTWQASVPADAEKMVLLLGLENVTGRVWFDDVRVTVRRPLPPMPAAVAAGKSVYRGHTLPRLRGAMVGTSIDEDGLRTLGRDWNANVIRWQLCGYKPRTDTGDLAAYDKMLDDHLRRLDAILPLCEKYGILVCVDLHTGPGQWAAGDRNLFASPACQKRFIEIWQMIARRYKDSRAVWAYDLLNEPHESSVSEEADDWQGLAERAARAIREIDPQRAIIVEPASGGDPSGMRTLRPIAVANVIYSPHMYAPIEFTHQGVFSPGAAPVTYPGTIAGKPWDKAALEKVLAPTVAFQRAYGAAIFIGEFSAIRWAPDGSGARYLKDCIDIFESHGWDWAYHAFREWDGWSVEHGPDRNDRPRAASPTDRQKVLCDWYAKNEKPAMRR